MGAIANMAPDRYRVLLSQVPFVDVVTTMLDAEHPADHQRIRRVGQSGAEGSTTTTCCRTRRTTTSTAQAYPAMFVGTGPVGFAGAVLRAGQVRGAPARPQHRRRSRCCSAPTWMPATAASPGASAATASWRRCMRSCSTSWPWTAPASRDACAARGSTRRLYCRRMNTSLRLPHRRRTAGHARRLRQQGSAGAPRPHRRRHRPRRCRRPPSTDPTQRAAAGERHAAADDTGTAVATAARARRRADDGR